MNNLIKNEIIEKFKKYNFQKYPFGMILINCLKKIYCTILELEWQMTTFPKLGGIKDL